MFGQAPTRWTLVLDPQLAPAPGAPARRDHVRWLLFAAATLKPAVVEAMLAGARGDAAGLDRARHTILEHLRVLEQALANGGDPANGLLAGEAPTAADVVIARVLAWAESLGVLEPRPRLAAYVQRVAALLPR